MKPGPDFNRLRSAVSYEEPDRLPLAELWIDPPVKAAFLGDVSAEVLDCRKESYEVQKDLEFWFKAGYDYMRITPLYEFPKSWMHHPDAHLTTLEEYERYPWPDLADIDYSHIERAARHLPQGMQLIASPQGGIFEEAWMVMGYETFMSQLFYSPELIEKVCDSLGRTLLGMFEKFATYPFVGGFWLSDDIAFSESLILSPEMIRKYLLPWYERFAAVAKEHRKMFFFHSDGRIQPMLDDFIAIGFDAIHPIEPKAMDIAEVKKTVKGKLALLGSVDLDFPLSRGSPDGVRSYVKKRIADIAPGGGFAIGSSNSVTHYVPLDNYRAMLDTVARYGGYPITINDDE